MATIDELTQELTPDQCMEALLNIVDVVGIPATAYQEGSMVRTILEADSDMISYCTWILSGITSAGFLETATGDWLDLIGIYGGSGLLREGATYGQGSVEITNTTGGLFTASSGTLVVRNSNTGKQYSNTAPISVTNGSSTVYTFQALEAGSASNAAEGEIVALTTSISGIAVENTTTFVALDKESEQSYRDRLRLYHQAKSPYGPPEAYKYWAKRTLALDGTSLGITKVKTIGNGTGNLTCIVASDVGPIASGPTGLDLVDAQLRTKALTQGPVLVTQSAVQLTLTGSIQAYCYNDANLTEDDVQDLILASITERVKALPIGGDNDGDPSDGGKFYRSSFLSACKAHPAIFRPESSSFSSDLTVAYNEVVVLGAFTITVNFLARPES